MADNIVYGCVEKSPIPNEPIGKVLFQCIEKKPRHKVAMVSLMDDGRFLTYGQILDDVKRCTTALRNLQVGRGDVVLIISENNIDCAIPILAAFNLGAAVNSLNPGYTTNEILHSASLSTPKVAFCSKQVQDKLKCIKDEIPSLEHIVVFGHDEGKNLLENFFKNVTNPQEISWETPTNFQNETICILSSSGTTGSPKSVALTHGNLLFTLFYMGHEKFGRMTDEAFVSFLPYFHVIGFFTIITGLYYSTKLVELTKFHPVKYLEAIQAYKPKKLVLAPPVAVFLAKSPLVESYDLSSVEDIQCGAAPLGKDVEDLLINRLNVPSVRQVYGLTEVAGSATYTPFGCAGKHGTSGVLLPNTCAKIRDLDTGRALGAEENGEICLKGPFLMKGYLKNPEETKRSFDEDGFFKTGDIGFYDEDGYFFVVDRLKDLIKFKGYQVPPAELEDVLLMHPGVKEAAVVGKPDERAGELPVAFIVRQPGSNVGEEELVKFVAEHVCFQKQLHGGVRFVEDIAKAESGKPLKRLLKQML